MENVEEGRILWSDVGFRDDEIPSVVRQLVLLISDNRMARNVIRLYVIIHQLNTLRLRVLHILIFRATIAHNNIKAFQVTHARRTHLCQILLWSTTSTCFCAIDMAQCFTGNSSRLKQVAPFTDMHARSGIKKAISGQKLFSVC